MKTIDEISFTIGDQKYTVKAGDVPPTTSLLHYLRENLHLTGTKKMCVEGGCGVCLVAVDAVIDGEKRTFSVNACLVPVYACHGWKIHTIEEIGNPLKGYNKVQKILADNDGTQCGFCSAGMVMNMYALNKDGPKTMAEIENSFGGNLCRCTGYRPILTAFKKLASDAPDKEADIEDLDKPICSKINCCGGCKKNSQIELESFCLNLSSSKWIKIYKLGDLFNVFKDIKSSTYRLVSGDTAKGVYRNPPPVNFYIDINSVPELHNVELKSNTLSLGANKSLNRTLEIFRKVSSNSPSWAYLSTIADHIDLIAGFSIRNTASLAGNLMIKHEHREFSSDLFLILETFNAKLVIAQNICKDTRLSPEQFLNTKMDKAIIKSVELSEMEDEDLYKYATYKIMPRAQNAHAMVNAGFLVKINKDNIVQSANIVYGGINESFIHAANTEKYLVGKNLFTNEVVQGALKMLDSEIMTTESPPDSSAEYRKRLSLSLFYKFILKSAPKDIVDKKFLSGGSIIERPVSTAIQEFGTNKDKYPVSEPIHKIEGLAQTSGQAKYIDDMPDMPNQLFAAFVLTDAITNSTIESIDTSAALNMDGVVAVYTAKDIPGDNNFIPSESGMTQEEKLLCDGTVEYFSQPIGIVVAKSHIISQEAARQVKITYKPPTKKPYLSIDDVTNAGDKAKNMIQEAANLDPKEKGNNIKKVVKGIYSMGRQYPFHMEVQCCSVIPTENGLDLYPSTQWMDLAQISAAKALKIPMSKINVFVRRLGGAFGAKISRNSSVSTAAAIAAYKTNCPVKMWLPLETNMKVYGSRIPLKVNYEVGVDDKGLIQYFDGKFYSDFGLGIGNDYVYPYMTGLIGHCYKKDRWGYKVYNVKTDNATNCYVRAPGSTEGMGSTEAILEHVAYSLDLDPWAVRMANYDEKKFPAIKQFFETMKTWGELEKRHQAVDTFNKENRWKKKGLSLIPMAWELLIEPRYSVLVSIFHGDGTVAISHGGIEMGQGINTKIVQACAQKLGLDLNMITVQPSYSVISSNAYNSGGSCTSEAAVYNLLKACGELLARMEPIKKKMDNPTWLELVEKCYQSNINLTASALEKPGFDSYYIYGMCATEVEVDILTGQKLISRVDIIEDIGESISPLIDIGQVEGAFVMGTGYYTQEEVIFSEEGEVLNNRTWNYKPPGAKDIPLNFRIKFPENNPNPVGVLRSKAVAEPPLCLTIAVPLAIRRALAAARKDADPEADSWIPFDGPLTIERTLLNTLNSYKQYVLK